MEAPEVRQCRVDGDPNFGCIAVKSAVPFGEWFVGNPGMVSFNTAGGHWAGANEVENWTVLDGDPVTEAPEEPETPDEQPLMPSPMG